jgi:PAS domain-containing protein
MPVFPIVLSLLTAAAPRDVEVRVHWMGSDYPLPELPAETGRGAAAATASWAPWAAEHGYRMALSADGRALLLVGRDTKRLEDELDLISGTLAAFDRLAPAPPMRDAPVTGAVETEPSAAAETGSWSWEWRDDGPELDTETVVVLRARDHATYAAALDRLAGEQVYLTGWTEGAKRLSGFVLERPLCAAFREDGNGSKEWDPRNELVHRLAQLLVSRRFGVQPYWLKVGIAWEVEREVCNSLYCFPYRDEFVYASEHGDWEKDLRNRHKRVESLAMADLSAWKRGSYDGEHARRAFGLVHFVARHHPGAMSAVLEDLRLLRDERGVVHYADGSWERIVGWEASAEGQREIFRRHLGDDFLDELLAFFQKGRKYDPKR